jgi:tRNA-dependent cyclodipeptide synthase
MPKKAFLKNKNDLNLPENCSAVVPISVGQSYHENEKFEATIEFLKEEFSGIVTIVIADKLQRFTKALVNKETPDKFLEDTQEEGKKWLSRNETYICQLGDKLKNIIFWGHYLTHVEYEAKKLLVDNLYKYDETFKTAVDDTVKYFIRRHFKSQKIYNPEDFEVFYSREYTLEECAVLLLWPVEKYNLIIYPNKLNQAMYNLLQRFVYRDNPDLLKTTEINFKEYNCVLKSRNSIFKNVFEKNKSDREEAGDLLSAVEQYTKNDNIPYTARKNFIFSLSAIVGDARKLLHQQKELNHIEDYKNKRSGVA